MKWWWQPKEEEPDVRLLNVPKAEPKTKPEVFYQVKACPKVGDRVVVDMLEGVTDSLRQFQDGEVVDTSIATNCNKPNWYIKVMFKKESTNQISSIWVHPSDVKAIITPLVEPNPEWKNIEGTRQEGEGTGDSRQEDTGEERFNNVFNNVFNTT